MKKLLWASAALIGATGTAQSADEIIVEGLRLPTPIDQSGSSVSVITADDIDLRAYQFALDAVASAPGVTVNQAGMFGGVATVRIRGAASEQTLVLLNGAPIADPSSPGGGYDFSQLDASEIERIEVLRGPHSTLWGSDAIGGVINIVTKRPDDGLTTRAFAEGGSYKTFRAGAAASGGNDLGDFRLSVSGISSDGLSKADEADGNSETDGYDNITVSGRGGLNLGDLRLEVNAQFQDSFIAFDGFPPPSYTLADTDDAANNEQFTGSLRARLPLFDKRLNNEISLSYYDINRQTIGAFGSTFDGDRLVLRYQGTADLAESARVAFGAEREETSVDTDETSINALFGVVEVTPLEGLTVTGGVRYDDHSTFGDVTTFRASLAYALNDLVTIRGSWGEGFKAPTIFQLTNPFGLPNFDLAPEESDAFDIGVLLRPFDGKVSLDIAYFNRDTKNEIIFASNFQYQNLQLTEAQGVEALFDWGVTENVNLSANYTYIDAKNGVTGDRQIRTPRHSADLAVSAKYGAASGAVTIRYNGEELGSPFDGDTDDWIRVDLSGTYQLSDIIEVYGRVENLLDADYQQLFGYGTPGLSAYGGVRLTF